VRLLAITGKQHYLGVTLLQLLDMNITRYKNQIFKTASSTNGEYDPETKLGKTKVA
jgi:hypothetical protein